jgi:CO/xanthine dehydrogenase FAD-binding subunit
MTVRVPLTIDDAVAALHDAPESVLLAGGTDLLVATNAGHRRFDQVIALDRVGELRRWSLNTSGTSLFVGAGVPYTTLMGEPFASLAPALSQASRTVGSPQIRNAGTLGGNLGTCSPAGDGLPVLAALDAIVHLRSSAGERTLGFSEFMVGVKRNARAANELITGVTLPILTGWQGYSKVGVRNAMVIATASSCLAADVPNRSVRVALGSVGPVIIRCTDAEEWIVSRIDWDAAAVTQADVDEFGERCAAASRPIDDHRSTASYRRHAVRVLASRQLRRAFPNG